MEGKHLRISVLSDFYIAFILDGLQRLSGLFVLELLQSSVNVSRQDAFTPFIFSWVVSNVIASLIGTENKRLEYVILFGVLLSATGAALCLLTTDIIALTVFWGLIFGSGHGLASPHLSKNLKYENLKLSFILQVTPCLGVAIMPFAFSVLNSYYGLQGSYLIFCGMIINYIPLALAAAYDIEIRIPNIKWRVRKKTREYSISNQDASKAVSNDSFINSLEPDLILKICQNDESHEEINGNKFESSINDDSGFIQIPLGRKRSETRGNDLQGLDTSMRFFPRNITHPQIAIEIKKYEKGRSNFEGSFSNKDIVQDGMQCTKSDSNIICDIHNSIKMLENMLNDQTELDLKKKTLPNISEYEASETDVYKETEDGPGNNTARNPEMDITCVAPPNVTLEILDSKKSNDTLQTDEKSKNEKILPKIKQKENLQLSQPLQNKSKFNVPLDIKVHIEECLFHTDDDDWDGSFSKYLENRKNSYSKEQNINSTLPNKLKSSDFPNHFSKSSDHQKPKFSKIYSIFNFNDDNIAYNDKNCKVKENNTKQILNFLSRIWSRVCLCILLINIIFELNLVILLMIFADFGSDVDDSILDFKWILVAFGCGGIIGKICCCKISSAVPEKCNSIGVVLFLLTGLTTAGVLYSPNLSWLAGFYCILGALEGGITYIIPKFVFEYTHKDMQSILTSMKRFLSGISMICIPYIIGLFRDEMDDYEFLLQILSCSSVLCAFLIYFLPFSSASNKQKIISIRNKLETA